MYPSIRQSLLQELLNGGIVGSFQSVKGGQEGSGVSGSFHLVTPLSPVSRRATSRFFVNIPGEHTLNIP